jgi:hypothetical protein
MVRLALMLVACGSGDSGTAGTNGTGTASSAGSGDGEAEASDGAATAEKVNANTATVTELTAAFESAGVPNASKWAREVEEYRPYEDDGWVHLREELDKYNIDDATFEKITSVLEL